MTGIATIDGTPFLFMGAPASPTAYPFPTLRVLPRPSLFDYEYEDLEVLDYRHHPAIKAPVAV